jgi:anionic cell wall polymer biosynthesis LytR-Cps2A-Psr (LCP) family protein
MSVVVAAVFWLWPERPSPGEEIIERQKVDIDRILDDRYKQQFGEVEGADPFGDDGIVRILFIGLDSRVGQTAGHCDAIQLIEINKNKNSVEITAVPRGTYAPLKDKNRPPGDYYVSNSCAIEGLDYGIDQIEKILGKKADYLAMVGFSEAMGIIRQLKLPGPETLQWLRHRQGYAIGEPQRAHNHSSFLKEMLIRYVPKKDSKLDASWEYVIYKMIKTDLSFEEGRKLVSALIAMDLSNHPERIVLSMRPAYQVADIPYDEDNISQYLSSMLTPIKDLLSDADYSEKSKEQIEADLLAMIDERKDDPEFLKWVYDNKTWLQFNDEFRRQGLQYDLTVRYVKTLADPKERLTVMEDYVLEMEYLGLTEWSDKGKMFLEGQLSQ